MLNNIIRKIIPKQIKGYSLGIHISVIILSIFGVLMVLSANAGIGATGKDLLIVFIKELGFTIVSYIFMLHAARRFNFKIAKKHALTLIGITLFMLIVPLGFGSVGGAYAWIKLPGMTIQPSEFAKIIMILIFAVYLGDRQYNPKMKAVELVGVPFLFLFSSVAIIFLLQKDLGSAAVMLFMTFFVFMVPVNKTITKVQTITMILFLLGFISVIFLSTPTGIHFLENINMPSYMYKRFLTVSDPFTDTFQSTYHVFNGFVSFVSGGLGGRGLGSSLGKHGYIPEARTDFILAVIVEELGMFGLGIILFFYGVILFALIRNAFKMKYERDRMILLGVAAYLMVHFLFNVGGITALIPLTGVPLLLISSGTSSKLSFMIAIGIAQSTIAKGPKVKL